MIHLAQRPTWIEICQASLTNNVRQMLRLLRPGCRLMAIVKANAYGHGLVETAQIFMNAGAERLGVATLAEAIELRNAGICAPILVLGYSPGSFAGAAIEHHVALTVYDEATVYVMSEVAAQYSGIVAIHVKVNSGMNRLGVAPDEAFHLLQLVHTLSGIDVEGIYTHFATADAQDKQSTREQFTRFAAVLAELSNAGLRLPLAHAANSAATLTLPETHLDMVRCGIALYGMHPDVANTPLPANFQPALSWKAHIAQIRELVPGEGVSYGHEYIAKETRRIATLPVGYADGFPRAPQHWGSVLIHGQAAPIIGRVCMDQTMIDITDVTVEHGALQQGDEVLLLGTQNRVDLLAEEIGARVGTINYEVTSRILPRVPRIYC